MPNKSDRWPHVTVVIETCDRAGALERCLAGLTGVKYPSWDVLVVDQSEGAQTKETVDRWLTQLPSIEYHHMNGKGCARAANLAMNLAEGDIIAFLDDDCTVRSSWLQDVVAAFARHPKASVIFGTVRAAPHDDRECYIPCHEIKQEQRFQGRWAFLRLGGVMGASMYVRPAVFLDRIPFDNYTGAGAHFAGYDRDFAYRVLAAGQTIVTTPSITVEHFGARSYRGGAASRLVRRAALARGAMDGKFIRCGDPVAVAFVVVHLLEYTGMVNLLNVFRNRPSNLGWPILYLYGLLTSLQMPVSRRYGLWGREDEYAGIQLAPFGESLSRPGGQKQSDRRSRDPQFLQWH